MVNPKDLKALQGMWTGAKPQMDCSVPDGNYEFLIIDSAFKITANGIPQMVTTLEIVGGNDAFIGEKIPQRDSLATADNMGWFKKKLARLGITIPEDVEELTSRIPGELKGKKFAGQLKTKDEFVNIYVNKFIEDVDLASRGSGEETSTETQEETTEETSEIVVGNRVMFTSVKGSDVEGELIEILKDKMRIKTDEGKIFKVDTAKVSLVVQTEETEEAAEETEEATEETPEETTEENAEEGSSFPTPEEVKTLKLPELKKVLADNDMDINVIKNPRMFVGGLSGFMYNEKYIPDLATLLALRDGLKMKVVKNEKPIDMKKRVLVALHKSFEF